MTKSAQIIVLLSALLFGTGAAITFITANDLNTEIVSSVEGIISKVDCPRKYAASIMLKNDESTYSLAKQFKDKTSCIEKNIAKNLIGKPVKMRVNKDNQVFSLTLNHSDVFTIDDLKQEKLITSKVLIFISLLMVTLVVYKRKTA